MSAQPGWYDAGVPGRERWWDGTQWTDHEREATPRNSSMGWYPVAGTADVRWWDGFRWTPYRLRGGSPKPDVFAVEPPGIGIALGILFILLGLMQLRPTGTSDAVSLFVGPVFAAVGVIWLIGGTRDLRLQKLSVPQTGPVFESVTRPLPGEVDGVGAGWYPVSGSLTRWWTGTRWSPYVTQRFGVRPTHASARGYFAVMIIGGLFAAVGALILLFGLATLASAHPVATVVYFVAGLALLVVGGIVLAATYARRFGMILPKTAPPLR